MVNRGASRGCITCRERHVKCDERKPWCKACLRLGYECKGYGRTKPIRVRFRDETARYTSNQRTGRSQALATSPHKHEQQHASRHDYAILSWPLPPQQDLAVSFFLTYVTDIGRSLESTRGFLEFIGPVLATQHVDSALSAAVNAVAIKVWAIIGHCGVSASLPDRLLGRALVRLQRAVKDPQEREQDATVMATLVLQLYDTLSAVSGQRRADGTHRTGALTLLLQRRGHVKDSKYHADLVGNILRSKASLCVREWVPLPWDELEWFQSQVTCTNPSSVLDFIGIALADIQHTFSQSLPRVREISLGLDLPDRIRTLDEQLRSWLDIVPKHWYPKRIYRGENMDSSIDTYCGTCDVYPSLQIANVWNTWRIYRLILHHIMVRLESTTNNDNPVDDTTDTTQHTDEAQELVNSICHSVPFYLGNCSHPAVLSDMEGPTITFPSYHDLEQSDEAFQRYQMSNHYVSRIDHARHVLLHGPLHCISALSHLIALFDDEDGLTARQTFRHEQKHWVSEQFLRCIYLLRLVPHGSLHNHGHFAQSRHAADKVSRAQIAAKLIRKDLWTMTVV